MSPALRVTQCPSALFWGHRAHLPTLGKLRGGEDIQMILKLAGGKREAGQRPRFPAERHLSHFSPPDRHRRVDSSALSGSQSSGKVERVNQFLKSVIKKHHPGDLPGVEGGFTNSSPLHPYSEKAMAPHSSTLAWKIPWTEEPGRL